MRIIAGRWKGHGLKTVKGRDVRTTIDRVREAWFSALGNRVVGARVVALFAGSGALGLEAASRGAAEVTLVDDDVFRFLGRLEEPFDIALADPPYDSGDARRMVELYLREPFAQELWLEHAVREDLDLPDGARTRRYGDTALTTLRSES